MSAVRQAARGAAQPLERQVDGALGHGARGRVLDGEQAEQAAGAVDALVVDDARARPELVGALPGTRPSWTSARSSRSIPAHGNARAASSRNARGSLGRREPPARSWCRRSSGPATAPGTGSGRRSARPRRPGQPAGGAARGFARAGAAAGRGEGRTLRVSSSSQGPAALTTSRARASSVRPVSASRSATPATRPEPARSSSSASAWLATTAPASAAACRNPSSRRSLLDTCASCQTRRAGEPARPAGPARARAPPRRRAFGPGGSAVPRGQAAVAVAREQVVQREARPRRPPRPRAAVPRARDQERAAA